MRKTTLAFAIVVFVSITPAAADPSGVALSIDAGGAVVAPVTINDSGPFLFLVDTGSSHSVMSDSLRRRLALEPVAAAPVLTSTGRAVRPVVKLDSMSVGTARSEGLLVSVVSSAQLDAIARGIEGIVGQDFLFAFNFTLHYRHKRLSWTAGDVTERDARLPLIAQSGRYLVEISASPEPVRLVPDSGANFFVAFSRRGKANIPLEPPAQEVAVHSLSGRQLVQTMWLRELELDGVTLRNQPVAVIAREPADLLEGDGLLPLHLFESVSFDVRNGYMVIRPRR